MTRFALAGKWGFLGARGLAEADAPDAVLPLSSSASAIAPMPTPHCLKNQRRVRNFEYSDWNSGFIMCFLVTRASSPCRRSSELKNLTSPVHQIVRHGLEARVTGGGFIPS